MTDAEQPLWRDFRGAVMADLFRETVLGVVLRGHLYVEAALTLLLETVLPMPGQVDLDRMSYLNKLGLTSALGFLRPVQIPAYVRLNALRNRMAHQLDVEFTERDVRSIFATVPAADLWGPQPMIIEDDQPDAKAAMVQLVMMMLTELHGGRERHDEGWQQVAVARTELARDIAAARKKFNLPEASLQLPLTDD